LLRAMPVSSSVPIVERRAALDKLLAKHAIPGAVVAVRAPDGAIQTLALGSRDRAGSAALPLDVPLPIGSVGKVVLGAAVLVACRDQRIGLDTPVRPFLPPNLRERVPSSITWRMLGTHTSGLAEPIRNQAFQAAVMRAPGRRWLPEEILAFAFEQRPAAPPGERHVYSNANSVLLGEALAVLRGQSAVQAIQELVLAPLALRQTDTPAQSTWRAHGVRAYRHARPGRPLAYGQTFLEVTPFDPSWAGLGGDWSSTVDDLCRLMGGLAVQQALGRDTLRELAHWVDADHAAVDATRYGFHWMARGRLQGHLGDVPGFSAVAWVDREQGTAWAAIANLSNTADGRHPASLLLEGLIA
jgi:D-alanyl-D-alanine carboxypeptidase